MSALLAPLEPYLWAGLVAALLLGGVYEVHRLEAIGEQKTQLADAKARQEEQAKLAAQTAALQAQADKAAEERDVAQQALKDYMDAHPVGHVFVCRGPTNSGTSVSASPGPNPGAENSGPGPGAVPQVSAGSLGIDIGPSLDAIVRAAAAVSGNYAELQRRQVDAKPNP